MRRLLLDLLTERTLPEHARAWTLERWSDWLGQSAHNYSRATQNDVKRNAFRPFGVEPVSPIDPASQIVDQVGRFCPSALDHLVGAADVLMARWRPIDGAFPLMLALRIAGKLGFLGKASARHTQLLNLISKLDASISRNDSSDIADEIVNSALGRFTPEALRELGQEFVRCAPLMAESPWRAQLKILDDLLRIEGTRNLIENICSTVPTISNLVGMRPAKRRIGDIIADRLLLQGAVSLHDLKTDDETEKAILGALRACVFPSRIRLDDLRATDMLSGEQIISPSESSSPRDRSDIFRLYEDSYEKNGLRQEYARA